MMYGLTALLFERLFDKFFPSQGFILLNQQGHLFQITPNAKRLCQRLWGDSAIDESPSDLTFLPAAIQESTRLLIDGLRKMTEQDFRLEDDVLLEDQTRIRIQANWINIGFDNSPFMFLTLIDLTEFTCQQARFEAHRLGLTKKESEILLLRSQGLSYGQICEKQYVSVNTVKRHVKSINFKRRKFF